MPIYYVRENEDQIILIMFLDNLKKQQFTTYRSDTFH